ncbi:MAG: OB-fold protein [Agriterribacter sp.]
MAKKLMIFLAVIAIALLTALYWYNKPRQGVAHKRADIRIGAGELVAAYNSDEQAADKKFLNAVVEVKGIIEEVQVSSHDAIVILSMQPTGGGVSCRFSPASKLDAAKFKNGMEVMIKGRCAGFNMDVNLVDCEIIL